MADLFGKHVNFPPGYIDQAFTLWYSMGKPNNKTLHPKLPECPEMGMKPSIDAVNNWIYSTSWRERAAMLDAQVMSQINERMIAEKVEMLNRHADIAIEMQDMAANFLKEHKDELGVSTAVRLLVAGIEIERESRGIATTVEKITLMSDKDLEKEIEKLISRAPMELLPGDGSEDIDAVSTT